MSIIQKLKAARGNRKALLSLANEFTLQEVARHFDTSMQKAAPKVAQRVFDAQSITIQGTQVTYGRRFKKRYDLTDGNQACAALRWWGTASHSLATLERVGGDWNRYQEEVARHPSQLYRHTVLTLKLTRHRGA